MYPEVINYGSTDSESFNDYYQRWPKALKNIPKQVVESWIHRHWAQFQDWIPLKPETWSYELCELTNTEVLEISHVNDWPLQLEVWGRDLFRGSHRKTTWLGKYMLEHGTTPVPIIVGKNFGEQSHPVEFGDEKMKELTSTY